MAETTLGGWRWQDVQPYIDSAVETAKPYIATARRKAGEAYRELEAGADEASRRFGRWQQRSGWNTSSPEQNTWEQQEYNRLLALRENNGRMTDGERRLFTALEVKHRPKARLEIVDGVSVSKIAPLFPYLQRRLNEGYDNRRFGFTPGFHPEAK